MEKINKFSFSYQPQEEEKGIYKKWEENDYFNPNLPKRHKDSHCIITP